MEEKSKNKGINKGHSNLIPLKKGHTANPNGRPKGQRNYATIYREALMKIALANDKTPEDIETMLEETGLKNALKGNFAFWKDIRDRIHGKPVQPLAGVDGKPLIVQFSNAFTPQQTEGNNTEPSSI